MYIDFFEEQPWGKKLSQYRAAVEFDPDGCHVEIQIPSLRSKVICTNTS